MKLALAALPLIALGRASFAADPARYMTAELIAESPTPAPGGTIFIGIRMSPRPGWHGYWSNPGDSGIAPTVRWSAPKGVTFGPLLHPAPTLLTADGMSSFVHEGRHVLLSRMAVSRFIARDAGIPITAELSWAACTATQCVPLHATLSLQLTSGHGAKGPDWQELNAAAEKLPRKAPDGSFVREGRSLRLLVPALKIDPSTAQFFADEPGVFRTAEARTDQINGNIRISGPAPEKIPPSISGVLSDGRNAYRLSFVQGTDRVSPAAEARAATPDPRPSIQSADTRTVASNTVTAHRSESWPRSSLFWLAVGAALLGLGVVVFAVRVRANR